MTNEEKAKKIIGGECNRQDCHECGGSLSVVEGCVEFIHLKEMAEWKEKQMIDKACKWLKEHARDYFFAEYCGEELTGEVSMNDNFIEDFKIAMEE